MRNQGTIDFTALKADVQMAQQTGRKMCSIHVDELTSLLMRADALAKAQEFIPFKIGYCYPEDVHLLMQGELHRVGLSRKKGPKYSLEVLVHSLPDGRKKSTTVDLNALLAEST
jgi:hypothetical protein